MATYYRSFLGRTHAQPSYPLDGLILWADTSYGDAGVTRNSQGQVLAFRNRIAGQPDFQASAPLDYTIDRGSGLISLVNGDLTANWTQAQGSPVTYIQVLKTLPNTPYIQYQIPAELSNPATGDITRVFIKETSRVLIWDGGSYQDGNTLQSWPATDYALVGTRTSIAGDNDNGITSIYPTDAGAGFPGFFVQRTYTQARSAAGNYGVKLWLIYNRRLALSELNAIAAIARQRFAF